jgi:hypothetical protein
LGAGADGEATGRAARVASAAGVAGGSIAGVGGSGGAAFAAGGGSGDAAFAGVGGTGGAAAAAGGVRAGAGLTGGVGLVGGGPAVAAGGGSGDARFCVAVSLGAAGGGSADARFCVAVSLGAAGGGSADARFFVVVSLGAAGGAALDRVFADVSPGFVRVVSVLSLALIELPLRPMNAGVAGETMPDHGRTAVLAFSPYERRMKGASMVVASLLGPPARRPAPGAASKPALCGFRAISICYAPTAVRRASPAGGIRRSIRSAAGCDRLREGNVTIRFARHRRSSRADRLERARRQARHDDDAETVNRRQTILQANRETKK